MSLFVDFENQRGLLADLKKEMIHFGLQGEYKTIQEFYSWLRKAPLLFSPEKLQYNSVLKEYQGKTQSFSDITEIASGSFGTIQLAYLQSPTYSGYIFLKNSKKHQNSLVIEGLLQSCAHVALKRYGFSTGIPRVMNILTTPDTGVNLVLQRIPNAKMFAEYLKNNFRWNQPCEENDSLILQVIAQVATYVAILEYELGMNHRDLKSTNVLMIAPVEPYTKQMSVGPHNWTFKSNLQVSIIDFGFSCVGIQNGPTLLSAGNYLPESDFCPKDGRDLFLFFASLWAIPAFRDSITDKVKGLFQGWLQDSKEKSWADWLCFNEKDNLVSMYLLCSSSEFFSIPCTPIFILKDIHKVAPEIIPFASNGRPVTPVPSF